MRTAHIVRLIKEYSSIEVANAMSACGWHWNPPHRRPTNIESMLSGVPSCELYRILGALQQSPPVSKGIFGIIAKTWSKHHAATTVRK